MPVKKRPFKLLQIESVVRDTEWIIASHSNTFLCMGETIPCTACMQSGRAFAPLFLVGIETIAEELQESPLRLARIALNKMTSQQWSREPAWKKERTILQFPTEGSSEPFLYRGRDRKGSIITPPPDKPLKLVGRNREQE